MFSPRLLQNILLGLTALILLLVVLWGYSAGRHAGQSTIILSNVQAYSQGLQYFYNDQNRYPTPVELQDRNIMLNYFNPYPPVTLSGGSCSSSLGTYHYLNPSPSSYELDFCLPGGSQGWPAGWNKISK